MLMTFLCYICIRQMPLSSPQSIGEDDSFLGSCVRKHRHVTASRHSAVLM